MGGMREEHEVIRLRGLELWDHFCQSLPRIGHLNQVVVQPPRVAGTQNGGHANPPLSDLDNLKAF